MDILHELNEHGFQFESRTGYARKDNASRYIVFNRLKDDISITGFVHLYAHTNKLTYKISRMDLSGSSNVRMKEAKETNVDVITARAKIMDLVVDNKIMTI